MFDGNEFDMIVAGDCRELLAHLEIQKLPDRFRNNHLEFPRYRQGLHTLTASTKCQFCLSYIDSLWVGQEKHRSTIRVLRRSAIGPEFASP
jgi:hypothetical protein